MFDTHIHLNDPAFRDNLDKYINEARNAGVNYFLVIGYDLDSSIEAIEIAEKYEFCYAAIGYHPENIRDLENIEVLQTFLNLFNKSKKIKAIGEIGLDYHYENDEETKSLQKKWFVYQLQLAEKLNLPTSIHTRDAVQDTYDILKEHGKTTFILHCFNASKEMLEKYLKLDCYFAIGGVVTFKNAVNLQEILNYIPLTRLLLETDAPYLAPVPYRGKINEPRYIMDTLKFISTKLNIDYSELDKVAENNARKVLLNE